MKLEASNTPVSGAEVLWSHTEAARKANTMKAVYLSLVNTTREAMERLKICQ